MPFKFKQLALSGLVLIEPEVFGDLRGGFAETYKHADFASNGVAASFVQDNWSLSAKGVLRGMHYQNYPKAQGKLVSAARGQVFDVAVDLRADSPTYLRWVGVELSGTTKKSLYVPPGFAHGFCVLSEQAEVTYKVTAEYDPSLEKGFAWNDAEVGIEWPIEAPILSTRDQQLPSWREAQSAFVYKALC